MTLFEQIGETKLRAVVGEFYKRVLVDPMIGFMFQGKDRQRLVDKEYELIAALLGAGIKYSGRPMRSAHAQHTIFGGQFERRMQLLRNVFRDLAVPDDIAKAWLEHAESLRSQITRDRGSECSDPATSSPGLRQTPEPQGLVKLNRR